MQFYQSSDVSAYTDNLATRHDKNDNVSDGVCTDFEECTDGSKSMLIYSELVLSTLYLEKIEMTILKDFVFYKNAYGCFEYLARVIDHQYRRADLKVTFKDKTSPSAYTKGTQIIATVKVTFKGKCLFALYVGVTYNILGNADSPVMWLSCNEKDIKSLPGKVNIPEVTHTSTPKKRKHD